MIIMGIDPGFASLGLAVLDGERLLACDVIETKKEHAPRVELRVSVDDSRRLGEFCTRVGDTMDEHRVRAVAIEVFTVVPGKMAGGAIKTAMVYGALYGLARARGCLWLPLVPGDLKRGLCGLKSASKAQIQEAVSERVPDAAHAIAAIAKSKREHAADALAAAIVGQGEMRRLGVAFWRAA